jgi:NAD-dependent SIR2 family protein deacetylase
MIVGTSAAVTPAAWFPEIVLERGGTLIEINTEPTPFSEHCVASLRGASGELLPLVVDAVKQRLTQRG